MSEFFNRRLHEDTDLSQLLNDIANNFNLGTPQSAVRIDIGFEDTNIDVTTDAGRWVIKIFSKERTKQEIERYVNIIEEALKAGVHHPELARDSDGKPLYKNSQDVRAIATRFIEGKSFYKGNPPNADELKLIMSEAVKINQMSHSPEYLVDDWSVPAFLGTYSQINEKISPGDRQLIDRAKQHYDEIPFADLPKTFVHGDIIKSNVIMKDNVAYVFDLACANVYPRIQELAVMAANLLADSVTDLDNRVKRVQEAYLSCGGELNNIERENLYNYTLAAVLMEFVGSLKEEIELGETNEEIQYWKELSRQGLEAALLK